MDTILIIYEKGFFKKCDYYKNFKVHEKAKQVEREEAYKLGRDSFAILVQNYIHLHCFISQAMYSLSVTVFPQRQ